MISNKDIKQIAEIYNVDLNGCGPQGWREKVVPDKAWWLWGVNFKRACMEHDLCYGLGGDEGDRFEADCRFRDNIRKAMDNHWFCKMWGWRPSVKARMKLTEVSYYRAVKYGGKGSFFYHSREFETWQEIFIAEGIYYG